MFTYTLCLLGLVALACGGPQRAWRIIDGQRASRGQFPFIASLGLCTASILDEETVLTAAHCVCKGGPFLVTVGIIADEESVPNRQDVMVRDIVMHPDYKICGRVNPMDIAVLKLEHKIEFNRDVQPIELFCKNVTEGQPITIMGFGQDNRYKSGVLKYGHNTAHYQCDRGFICSAKQPSHIYFGDSGGPMVVMDDHRMKQAGVNSGISLVSMYANVGRACDWIALTKAGMKA